MSPRRIAVCREVTPKQPFASALGWPGWCRAGRDEGAALEALASYAGRYTPVAGQAGLSVPSPAAFHVVERVPGGPAHGGLGDLRRGRRRVTGRAAQGPAGWRPGPGPADRPRDRRRDRLRAQARVKLKQPAIDDIAAIEELRGASAAVVGAPLDGSPVVPDGWTTRYAARRIAWHVLEHAWEMQDRAESLVASRGGPARPRRRT